MLLLALQYSGHLTIYHASLSRQDTIPTPTMYVLRSTYIRYVLHLGSSLYVLFIAELHCVELFVLSRSKLGERPLFDFVVIGRKGVELNRATRG